MLCLSFQCALSHVTTYICFNFPSVQYILLLHLTAVIVLCFVLAFSLPHTFHSCILGLHLNLCDCLLLLVLYYMFIRLNDNKVCSRLPVRFSGYQKHSDSEGTVCWYSFNYIQAFLMYSIVSGVSSVTQINRAASISFSCFLLVTLVFLYGL